MGSENGLILLCILVVLQSVGILAYSQMECSYKYSLNTWINSKDPKQRPFTRNIKEDLIYKLYCNNQIATISYDTHILDKFKVKSCTEADVVNDILVEKKPDFISMAAERDLPRTVTLYYIKNKGICYSKRYDFINYALEEDLQRDTRHVTRHSSLPETSCERGEQLEILGNCKEGNFIYYNVHGFEYMAPHSEHEWYPATLDLDPQKFKADADVPHEKLLACKYTSGKYTFKLLCLKHTAQNLYLAFVGEDAPHTANMERFLVKSCQEDHIVNSIFPPKQSTDKGTHTIIYAYFQGHCKQLTYECPFGGFCTKNSQPASATCPSLTNVHPTSGTVGKWTNCEGPLKSPDIIDLTTR